MDACWIGMAPIATYFNGMNDPGVTVHAATLTMSPQMQPAPSVEVDVNTALDQPAWEYEEYAGAGTVLLPVLQNHNGMAADVEGHCG